MRLRISEFLMRLAVAVRPRVERSADFVTWDLTLGPFTGFYKNV